MCAAPRPNEPRSWAVDPEVFGGAADIVWSYVASGKTEHYAQLVAAVVQHEYVLVIRRRLRLHQLDVKGYASKYNLPYDRTSKVMRGAVAISFQDLARADFLLGEILATDLVAPVGAELKRQRAWREDEKRRRAQTRQAAAPGHMNAQTGVHQRRRDEDPSGSSRREPP